MHLADAKCVPGPGHGCAAVPHVLAEQSHAGCRSLGAEACVCPCGCTACCHPCSHIRFFRYSMLQADIMAKGWLEQLFKLARTNHDAVSFEALQLLCYRNRPAVQKLSSMGAVQLIEEALDASDTGVPAKVG